MSPRPQIDHIRKPQLLDAAAAVIAERGMAATRIVDVAERAGTSSAGVLYWFATKDELLTQALVHDEERFNDAVVARLAGHTDPPVRLLALIDACVEDSDWTLWMELWTRALRDDELRRARQALEDRWRSLLAAVIEGGIESGDFAPADPERAALALGSLIDGLAVQLTLGDTTVSREQMRRICIDTAERLLAVDLSAAPAKRRELEIEAAR